MSICDSPAGQIITVPGTTIISPNHPNHHDNELLCQTTIRFAEGEKVLLKFIAFNLETRENCACDFLEIFDGENAGARSLGKFCGIFKPNPIHSTGNTLTSNVVLYLKQVID